MDHRSSFSSAIQYGVRSLTLHKVWPLATLLLSNVLTHLRPAAAKVRTVFELRMLRITAMISISYCDGSMREKDWCCRKRGMQAT